jgi:hypothetical protein
MATTKKTKKKPATFFYKYRAFSPLSVQAIVADEVYFVDPSSFNDPLDTKACVEADIAVDELKAVLAELVQRREEAALKAAAKTIGNPGPVTLERIDRRSRQRAATVLEEIEYQSTNPDYEGDSQKVLSNLLAGAIERELLKRYSKGIYCLGTRATCPLMWSHYGDQHRGLCIGYSVPKAERKNLHKVEYGGSRLVQASLVATAIAGDPESIKALDEAVLLRKAKDWEYEKEWRLLGARGVQRSPLELSSITFGMRCHPTVQHALITALQERDKSVKFFQMHEQPGSFKLRRVTVDVDSLSATYPERSLSALEGIEVIQN